MIDKLKDNLGVIESEKVNFILLNTIGDITFDKCGNTSESSGLDYINDTKLPRMLKCKWRIIHNLMHVHQIHQLDK